MSATPANAAPPTTGLQQAHEDANLDLIDDDNDYSGSTGDSSLEEDPDVTAARKIFDRVFLPFTAVFATLSAHYQNLFLHMVRAWLIENGEDITAFLVLRTGRVIPLQKPEQ